MPQQIIDLSKIDLSRVEYDTEAVRKFIPQRFEMEQLHGIIMYDEGNKFAIGYRDVRADEFWARGHIPGRPIFPGVLMIESVAQLCTFCFKMLTRDDPNRFLGYAKLEHVSFRGVIQPGDRVILVCKNTRVHHRLSEFDTQALVNGKVVFEAKIVGAAV
jgi:3-hydroxyacyl-[acyl-carrier-protein] dehydratase